jgi:hypothetical protein
MPPTRRRLFLLGALASAACRKERKSGRKEPLVGWRPFESWSGRGNLQTDSFDMMSGEWRIKWKTSNESAPGAGTFRITVHSAVSGRPLVVAVDHRGAGHDVAYVNEDPRLYHLVIESSNVDWSIAVEEAVVAEAP